MNLLPLPIESALAAEFQDGRGRGKRLLEWLAPRAFSEPGDGRPSTLSRLLVSLDGRDRRQGVSGKLAVIVTVVGGGPHESSQTGRFGKVGLQTQASVFPPDVLVIDVTQPPIGGPPRRRSLDRCMTDLVKDELGYRVVLIE